MASGARDFRKQLRKFFEVDRYYVAVAALKALADDGAVPASVVTQAIKKYGIDPDKPNPPVGVSSTGRAVQTSTTEREEERTLGAIKEVVVPDIGDFKDVPVIEVLVKPGDSVKAEDSLVTLESDKATMEVPAPFAGVVKEMKVKVGDKVSRRRADPDARGRRTERAQPPAKPRAPRQPRLRRGSVAAASAPAAAAAPRRQPHRHARCRQRRSAAVDEAGFAHAHASPAVRRFARELGVDLAQGQRQRARRRASSRRTCRPS